MTDTPTPDARGLIERAHGAAYGMRTFAHYTWADLVDELSDALSAALEAATTPPPAATGDEALLKRAENYKDATRGLGRSTLPIELAAALRQRGEDLAALLRDAKDVQQKWCDESNRAIRIEEQLERARDYGRRWHEAALGQSGEIDTLKARVTELEAALSAATARAEEAEGTIKNHGDYICRRCGIRVDSPNSGQANDF